ncbi:hypothetical protein [Streptomyces sp. NPDC059466]|uniref:hypothetical protein n=1 Tax=unclassified Streptomyces TaxID=2593676 RepID=UPI0036AB5674
MDSAVPVLVAVLGALLGSAATYLFQLKSSKQAENLAHQREVRSERMAVYSEFAGAVTEFRRCQYRRWHSDHGSPDNGGSEAVLEAYRARGIAHHVGIQVQLVTSDPALIESSRGALEAAAAMHRAVSAEQLRARDDEAVRSLERFIMLASGDVQ